MGRAGRKSPDSSQRHVSKLPFPKLRSYLRLPMGMCVHMVATVFSGWVGVGLLKSFMERRKLYGVNGNGETGCGESCTCIVVIFTNAGAHLSLL